MMTTINKVYCSPKTDEEWMSLLGYIPSDTCNRCVYYEGLGMLEIDSENEHLVNFDGMSEIEVSKFLDLAHDRITPWRLEEIGFNNKLELFVQGFNLTVAPSENPYVYIEVSHHADIDFNITTFTDLLTLIKFLTPRTT